MTIASTSSQLLVAFFVGFEILIFLTFPQHQATVKKLSLLGDTYPGINGVWY